MSLCPCGSQNEFNACCDPIIKGESNAQTAAALMRARYSAYTTGDIDFIIDSTHPDHREDMNREEIEAWSSKSKWLGLEIVDTAEGTERDNWGMVEFKANFQLGGESMSHHERSEFHKTDDKWFFVDGEPLVSQVKREGPKVGRNDPCPCGSGKKFKKCCAR